MQSFKGRIDAGIRNLIADMVKSEYGAKGHIVSEPTVNVEFQKSVTVYINTEDPFLGSEFWEFLAKLENKIEDVVKVFGYTYKGVEFFHDYCILSYEFKQE